MKLGEAGIAALKANIEKPGVNMDGNPWNLDFENTELNLKVERASKINLNVRHVIPQSNDFPLTGLL